MQASKTIYFADYPSTGRTKSGLTIPFSVEDEQLHNFLKPLSSHALRRLIGFDRYERVVEAAVGSDAPVATFVRELLRKKVKVDTPNEDVFFRIQSTFRGGQGSPLHNWYPYLEGYSPEFVNSIIDTFAPKARNILDPFCGSGTTALVAATRGGVGYYAEVNPVCRYVIQAKAYALTLSANERARVSDKLSGLSAVVTRSLKKQVRDEALASSFSTAFGSRPFFDERAFDAVLRARSFADQLIRDDPGVGHFFTIGVLRSLVPCSLLVRRGDLRFRTEIELARGLPEFTDALASSLDLISSDIMDCDAVPGRTELVSHDARTVAQATPNVVDAIITSPPYLNGTNYFRNTKIELWFLRKLSNKADLRLFRDAAITSGINDVTTGKLRKAREAEKPFRSKLLQATLEKLEKSAYDVRIPAMVENYFYDMHDVLAELPAILKEDGIVAVDLGDSMYSGIHVPTQDILAEMLEEGGLRLETTVVLRERQSRDGAPLCQTLQVFSPKLRQCRTSRPAQSSTSEPRGWEHFKSTLPHQSGEMQRRNWGHSWHSMCSYQGKLKPAIARCLVNALMPENGGRLLDTFSGVGTIPFEARMAGHTAFGFDISPAAVAISRAKLERVEWSAVDDLLDALQERVADRERCELSTDLLKNIKFNGPLVSYFHKDTMEEILIARNFFQDRKPIDGASALVFSSLLHILHGNRPYALSRRSHPITPFAPTGATEYRGLLERLRKKVQRCRDASADVPDSFGFSYFQDVTATWPTEVNELDAIITSPPFFDSTRFHTANWMRLWFAGWEAEDFLRLPAAFVDERQKKSFEIYENIFRQGYERLKPGGFFAIHVGKSNKCDMAASLQHIGQRHLDFVDWFSENVEHCESHGIRDKGTVTHHQYLLFRKAA